MKRIMKWIKSRQELKNHIRQQERHNAAIERMNLIRLHEKELRKQREELKAEYEANLKRALDLKNSEIKDLRKLIKSIKTFGENLQILSGEFEMELKTVVALIGRSQNNFANIEYMSHRATKKIEKRIDKFIEE
jgi:hypothetical protein